MKKTLLSALMATTVLASVMPANAIYNLYKKDGLSLDINGEANLFLEKDKVSITGQLTPIASLHEKLTDERLRLNPDMGASWIDFRASQVLNDDWRLTGTLGMGYVQGNSGMSLNNANVSLDKLNVGAITIGRQYLHTGHMTRTGTYTPLDTFGEQALRFDYYGVPNLHTSVYYLFPSSTDVRALSDSKTEGFGASASYKLPLSGDNHSLRFAAGYSDNRTNPASADGIPAKSNNVAGSVEYRLGKLVLAGDYGRRNAKLDGQLIAKADSDYVGAKIGYELTPRLNLMAGFGKTSSKRTYATGVGADDALTVLLTGLAADPNGLATQMMYPFLFDTSDEKMTYVRGDYYVRENMRVYGQVQKETTNAKVGGSDYAKLNDTSYRMGVSFVF